METAVRDLNEYLNNHDETRGTRVEMYRVQDEGIRWYWLDGSSELKRGFNRLIHQAHRDALRYIKSYIEVMNAGT